MSSQINAYLLIATVVATYWFVSVSTIFMNKFLLSSSTYWENLDCPLFITWIQCVVSVAVCAALGLVNTYTYLPAWINISKPTVSLSTSCKVLPLSCFFVIMISTNNFALKNLGVSFFSMSRFMNIIFNVVFSWLLLDKPISAAVLCCCFVMVIAFLVAAYQEDIAGSLSFIGIACAVISNCCSALFFVYTKRTIAFVDNNVWSLAWYNNLNACILFIPFIYITGELYTLVNAYQLTLFWFWLFQVAGGLLGFGVGLATALQIAKTSPLTHVISGTSKGLIIVILGVIIYNETKTYVWWLCTLVFIVCTLVYVYLKSSEMKVAKELETIDEVTEPKTNEEERLLIKDELGIDGQKGLTVTITK